MPFLVELPLLVFAPPICVLPLLVFVVSGGGLPLPELGGAGETD